MSRILMFIEIFVLDRCGRGLRKISVAAGGMCTQIGLALDGVGWTTSIMEELEGNCWI